MGKDKIDMLKAQRKNLDIAILKAEMVVLAESLRVAEEADAAAAKLLEREKAVLSVMREVRVWAGRRGRRRGWRRPDRL